MKPKNIVEINGKLYDAKTGAPLNTLGSAKQTTAARSLTTEAKSKPRAQKSIDGFSRANRPAKSAVVKRPEIKKPQTNAAPSRKVSKNVGNKAARSITLNRAAVKTPKIAASVTPNKDQSAGAVTSTALEHGDIKRFKRAQHVMKSSSISRFNHTSAPSKSSENSTDKPLTNLLEKTHAEKPIDKSADAKNRRTKEALVKKAVASTALHSAKSAEAKTKRHYKITAKKSGPGRIARHATTALAALLLAAYVSYLNVPSISMKVAAHRAGFAATLPTHKPAGYSMRGPIAYSPGVVTINFGSNTDDRRFSLSQQPTTWDSTALLENLVSRESKNYLTYQDSGLTIYLYGNSSAAWVSGGKLYQVDGENAQLNTDQLLKLATSV